MPPGKAALLFYSSVKYFLYFPSYSSLPPHFSSFLLPPTMTLKALLYLHLYIFFPSQHQKQPRVTKASLQHLQKRSAQADKLMELC